VNRRGVAGKLADKDGSSPPPSGGSPDRTRLRRWSPQNGNIRGQGRRLSAISTSSPANWEPGDQIECAKSRDFRRILAFPGEPGRTHDWLAGDAVLIAPVSPQIPNKQGILQGILRFWGPASRTRREKPLCCSDFSHNSLHQLTGKIFRRPGIFEARNGEFGPNLKSSGRSGPPDLQKSHHRQGKTIGDGTSVIGPRG
jgi:hypothetical protein